jgi:hypothetical protein
VLPNLLLGQLAAAGAGGLPAVRRAAVLGA